MKIEFRTTLYALIALLLVSSSAISQERDRDNDRRTHGTNGRTFQHQPRSPQSPLLQQVCPESRYRSIDGTCNNRSSMHRIEYGATDIELYRSMESEYGLSDVFNSMSGDGRPTARAVSNAICDQSGTVASDRGLSSFVFTWGQFLDHDISLTPEGENEYEPVTLPDNEPLFTEDIPFHRSEVHDGTGETNYRQQTNLITSWIDASNVYGSDQDRADWLRTFIDGKLKSSDGNLLPFNTIDGEYGSTIDANAPSMAGDRGGTVTTYVAGDVRAAEQPGLTSLHTVFMRYHNVICDRLISEGLSDDEDIYQQARKEVGATIQSITYNEFLPALGIELSRSRGYRSDIQADIFNLFATAAYRLGHTMVTERLLLRDDNCNDVDDGELTLLEGFFNVEVLMDYGVEPILNGLADQTQNEVDPLIIDNLRNFLFGDPTAPVVFGLDLASLNIQRGRDHGLPDYVSVSRKYTNRNIRDFEDISRDRALRRSLRETYNDINDIDLWVGLLSEDKQRGSSLGPTLTAIMKSQFEKLRDGDRFFYTHDRFLSRSFKNRISNTKLSDVITITTEIENIQNNVFIAQKCEGPTSNARSIEIDLLQSFSTMELMPNPVSDAMKIEVNGLNNQIGHVTIYDEAGRPVLNFHITQVITRINVDQLPVGVYTAQLISGDTTISQQFVKVE